jgi:hypothetical protein
MLAHEFMFGAGRTAVGSQQILTLEAFRVEPGTVGVGKGAAGTRDLSTLQVIAKVEG